MIVSLMRRAAGAASLVATSLVATSLVTAALVSTVAVAGVANAQAPSAQRASRTELASQLAALESQISAGALKGDKKTQVEQNIADIKDRLENGDFKVGNRFTYSITTDSVRSDTASVRDGLNVTLMGLPDVSIKGVLRSELDAVLTAHVLRYVKNASVRTVSLVQVSVLGAVTSPGFKWVSPDKSVSELITLAGGPSAEANLREIEIKRANRVILKAKDSRKALEESRTIEQVDIRSGDEVRVPTKRKINWGQVIQLLFVASSLFFAAIQFIQWYYNNRE